MSKLSREISVATLLVGLLLLLALFGPSFYQAQPLLSLATREAPTLIVAVGMAWIIINRQIDISVGSQFAVLSVATGLLLSRGWPLPAAALASLGLGALLGALNGWLVSILQLPSIVVTLATMVTWREALRWAQQGVLVNLPPDIQWFGATQTTGQVTIILGAVILFAAAAWASRSLSSCRYIYAVGSDPESARLAGIPTRKVTWGVFVCMGLFCGVAAVLNAVQSPQVDPKTGSGLELKVIAACVVGGISVSGGRGRLIGVLLGLLLLIIISPALVHLHINAYWEKAIHGGIILMAVLVDGWSQRRRAHV